MIQTEHGYARQEYFSLDVAADSRRSEFDIKNHSLIFEHHKPDFVFVGDSITHYWELNNYFYGNGKLIVNRGIGGDITTYLKERFFVDVLQLKPKYCIMGIGINDSVDLEGDYWKLIAPKPYDEIVHTAQSNIADIIQQTKKTDTQLILTSILPIDIPILQHRALRDQYIQEMNKWLKQMAEQEKLIFVDYYAQLVNPETGRIKEGITYDGLHPDARGYQIMVDVLRKTLKRNGIEI